MKRNSHVWLAAIGPCALIAASLIPPSGAQSPLQERRDLRSASGVTRGTVPRGI